MEYIVDVFIVRDAVLKATLKEPVLERDTWRVSGVSGTAQFKLVPDDLYPNVTRESGVLRVRAENFKLPVWLFRGSDERLWCSLNKPERKPTGGWHIEGGTFIALDKDLFPNLTYDCEPVELVGRVQEGI